jgi:hypothetical protein
MIRPRPRHIHTAALRAAAARRRLWNIRGPLPLRLPIPAAER